MRTFLFITPVFLFITVCSQQLHGQQRSRMTADKTVTIEASAFMPSTNLDSLGVKENVLLQKGGLLHILFYNKTSDTVRFSYSSPEFVEKDHYSVSLNFPDVSGQNRTVNLVDLQHLGYIRWFRWSDNLMMPLGSSVLSIQADDRIFKTGSSIGLTIGHKVGERGQRMADQGQIKIAPPSLKIVQTMASPDYKKLTLFVRSSPGSRMSSIDTLTMNGKVTPFEKYAEKLGGNEVSILEISFEKPLVKMTSVDVCLSYKTEGDKAEKSAATFRILEPFFPFGTWGDSWFWTKEEDTRLLREIFHNTFVGMGDFNAMQRTSDRYFFRSTNFVVEPYSPYRKNWEVDREKIRKGGQYSNILTWTIGDEIEANYKHASGDIVISNDLFKQESPSIPTLTTLCQNNAFNAFGNITDIVMQDHYSMCEQLANNAPVPHLVEEAFWYQDALRENTEPKLNWSWSQLAFDWRRQAPTWGVRQQAWMNLMAGSKGILWFATLSQEKRAKFGPQMDGMLIFGKELNQVKDLVLYSATSSNAETENKSHTVRNLIGRNAVLCIVSNFGYKIVDNPAAFRGKDYLLTPMKGKVSFEIPAWMKNKKLKLVEIMGEKNIPLPVVRSSENLTIEYDTEDLGCDTKVYCLVSEDHVPVAPETAWLLQDDAKNWVISWKEATDDIGVCAYNIYRNGKKIKTVLAPILTLEKAPGAKDVFEVQSVDFSRQVSLKKKAMPKY
jgi:hypothetical protein